jgi:hypothetical protein
MKVMNWIIDDISYTKGRRQSRRSFVYVGNYLPDLISFPGFRLATMSLLEYFFGERVF